MVQGPRPNALLLVAATIFAAPLFLLIAYCLLPFGVMFVEPNTAAASLVMPILGGLCSTIPGAFLVLEYRAIRANDSRAAGWIAGLCLGLAALGSIAWVEGLLRLIGVLRRDSDWGSWWDLGLYSTSLLCLVFIGFEHQKWCNVLQAAKKVTPPTWDA